MLCGDNTRRTPTLIATATIDTANVLTVDSSNQVLIQVDQALQQLATQSAQLGAYQNRFQAAITGLNTDSTYLTSARSQIQDTDYAAALGLKAQTLEEFCDAYFEEPSGTAPAEGGSSARIVVLACALAALALGAAPLLVGAAR